MSEPFVLMRARLLADTNLTETLGISEVFPMEAIGNIAAPFLVFSVTEGDQQHYSLGATDDITQSIDLKIVAESYETAWTIARRVQTLLAGWVDGEAGRWSLESGPGDDVLWVKEGSDTEREYQLALAFKVETVLT